MTIQNSVLRHIIEVASPDGEYGVTYAYVTGTRQQASDVFNYGLRLIDKGYKATVIKIEWVNRE